MGRPPRPNPPRSLYHAWASVKRRDDGTQAPVTEKDLLPLGVPEGDLALCLRATVPPRQANFQTPGRSRTNCVSTPLA